MHKYLLVMPGGVISKVTADGVDIIDGSATFWRWEESQRDPGTLHKRNTTAVASGFWISLGGPEDLEDKEEETS